MTEVKNAVAAVLAMGLLVGVPASLLAQQQERQRQHREDPGMGQPGRGMMQQGPEGMWGPGMGPGMMGQVPGGGPGGPGWSPGMGSAMMGQGYGPGPGMTGPWHVGPHMMSPDEMQEMMEHMSGTTGHGPFGPGMTAPGMGPRAGGWLGLEGRRVVPTMQLSSDDVRSFLERYLAALGNDRLKVGDVTAVDDDTITAEVVTVDDSLVESFEVDRHTGVISAAG